MNLYTFDNNLGLCRKACFLDLTDAIIFAQGIYVSEKAKCVDIFTHDIHGAMLSFAGSFKRDSWKGVSA